MARNKGDTMKFKLREDNKTNSAMAAMVNNMQYQDDPYVGIFWYDVNSNRLFGVNSTPAEDAKWYESPQFGNKVRTDKRLHQNIWRRELYKKRDSRFFGDYTKVPRGRVFEFENDGFKVYVGNWIKKYPECRQLIIEEFQLPANTEFVIDSHWDLGHGWSDEF